MTIADLLKLMPASSQVRTHADDWKRVESDLGLILPVGYKNFIDAYGGGKIAGFMMIFSPFVENKN